MNARQLLDALQDFTHLQTFPEAALRLLIERYPYCANLYLLHTYKLHQSGDPAFTSSLEMAALQTLDRVWLAENIRTLSHFLQQQSAPPFGKIPSETIQASSNRSNPLAWHSGSESLLEKMLGTSSYYKLDRSTLGLIASIAGLLDPPGSRSQHTGKSPGNTLAKPLKEKPAPYRPPGQATPPSIISAEELEQAAEKSIAAPPPVATETLAKILAKQGQLEKAIEMYKQLILIFPEKKTYFAAAIEKLKNQ